MKSSASTHAVHLVHQLIESAATEGGVGPLTDEGRQQLLGYLADLEEDLAGDETPDPVGPFAVLPREHGLVDVVRLGDVGTQQEQARKIVAERVGIIAGETAAAVLNGIAEMCRPAQVIINDADFKSWSDDRKAELHRCLTARAPRTPAGT